MDRRTSTATTESRDLLRGLQERLRALEKLVEGLMAGTDGTGSRIVVGGIVITVTDTGAGGRDLTATNPLTGLSSTLSL